MAWQTPITDRSPADLANGSAKGYYQCSDLNRVSNNTAYLATELAAYGYPAAVTVKSLWQVGDFPTATLLKDYLQNIRNLLAAFHQPPAAPPLPASMNALDWQGANAIEEVQRALYELMEKMVSRFAYSGTFASGESLL